jgi:hypothetical protein
MSELGLKSTREDKSEGEEGGHILRPLSECSFLKEILGRNKLLLRDG